VLNRPDLVDPITEEKLTRGFDIEMGPKNPAHGGLQALLERVKRQKRC
jgi:hypothetical protein